jgi:hypothetical protein
MKRARDIASQKAVCEGADFSGADLSNGKFQLANLRNANMSDAKLKGAHFSRANLVGCTLNWSEVLGVDMISNFQRAQISLEQWEAIMLPPSEKRLRNFIVVGHPHLSVPDSTADSRSIAASSGSGGSTSTAGSGSAT